MSKAAIEISPTRADDRRRIVMPPELPPDSPVSIQPLGDDCWIVRRLKPSRNVKLVPIAIVSSLPDDPKWEKTESAFAAAAVAGLKPPKE